VPFGELFDDEVVQQHYEGLAATLKAAKKSEYIVCKNLYLYGNRSSFRLLVICKNHLTHLNCELISRRDSNLQITHIAQRSS
jgi:hypothetical protein